MGEYLSLTFREAVEKDLPFMVEMLADDELVHNVKIHPTL